MRQATNLEIKHYIDYRSKHVAMVQRLGKLAFNENFSTHDHDKLELDGETLSKFALWFAYINNEYKPTERDLRILKNLNIQHYLSQKHHPEYWDIDITPSTFTEDMTVKATRMSKKAIREMTCDWTACCLYKNQPVFKFYNETCTGDNPKFIFTINQKNYIVECLSKLQKIIREENIFWAGKDYTAEQIEPIKESISNESLYDYENIIHSKNFKAWFGDWENDPENASKVVDENGKPLVVYHGARTTENFDTFDNSINFFTDNKDIAEMFANEYAYILIINNEDSIILDKDSAINLAQSIDYYWQDILEDFNRGIDNLIEDGYITTEKFNDLIECGCIQGGLEPKDEYTSISIKPTENKVYSVFLNIRNPNIIDFNGKNWENGDNEILTPQPPYDGVIAKNIIEGGLLAEIDGEDVPPATDFVVIYPNQIKSIDNNGDFSIESKSIYENIKFLASDKNQLQKFCNLVTDHGVSLEYQDLDESYFKGGYNWKKGMSNRAVDAYEEGKMPISYWRNNTTLNSAIENESGCIDDEAIKILTSLPIEAKLSLLTNNNGEYHHTGKFFKKSYFYSIMNLSAVTAKDAEEFKQEWEDYSKKKREYNKYVKEYEYVNKENNIFETSKGVQQISYINGKNKYTYLRYKPVWKGELKGTLSEVLFDKIKFKYIVMSSDGRYVLNTETDNIEIAKKYRAELSAEDPTSWYTIKKIPLKECECSGGISGGNNINASSNIISQAPENVISTVILKDDDVLKDLKLKEFKDTVITTLKESIIDIPQKEYYKGVLTEGDKMNPSLRKQIIQTVYDWTQLIDFDFNVYKIVAKGSLLTKRYNDTTDLDITVYTDLSKEQLDSIYSLIPRGENIKVDGKETSHAMDIYILTKGKKLKEEDSDNLYDVANNKWIKRSEEYDSEIPLNYALEVANFFINGCTIALSNYHNDKIMYEYYKSLDTETQEITEKEKTKAIAEVKSSLQSDLDGMRLALYMISSFRQDVYGEDTNPFHISIDITSSNPHNSLNEVMTKLIEKFNIREELRNCVKECSELLGTVSITESTKNKTVAFTFGRMNVPTIGHLLLLTKLATTTADKHYVYTSHTQDNKKNPLDYATKASLIQTIIKENNLNEEFINTNARTIIDVAIDLYEKGFKNIIFVGGSDTAEDICKLLKKYNDVPNKEGRSYHFDSIEYVVAGIRNPDSDDIDGVSATKVRQFAKDGDFKNFNKYLAVKDKQIAKEIFDLVKKILK